MWHVTHHQGLFQMTRHCTTESISGWGMQPCLKWCKGNKFLSVSVISTCFCDFYLCFVVSTHALQINTIKPPRAIYIDSSHFLIGQAQSRRHLPRHQFSFLCFSVLCCVLGQSHCCGSWQWLDLCLFFVISTYALQINTIKPPRVIYIDSSLFLTNNNKVYKTWFEIFAPLTGAAEV